MEGKKIESSSELHNYDKKEFKAVYEAGELNHIPDSEVSYINSSRFAKSHVLKALQNREYNGKFTKDMRIVTVEAKPMVTMRSSYYFD